MSLAPVVIALFAVDLEEMRTFYEAVIGLETALSDDDVCIGAGDGYEVTFLRVPKEVAADIALEPRGTVRTETPIKASFLVDSIDAASSKVIEHGGQLVERGPFTFNGAVHLDVVDPEGNVIQLRERAN